MPRSYGKWEVVRSLAEGGQGHLFLVRDTIRESDERFVLKRLKNAKRLDLFEREIRAVGTLHSANILRVEDFNLSDSSTAYYVAERCEQGSLAEVGAEVFKGDIIASLSVLVPIIDALSAAHKLGIVHRDVKPQNILLRRNDEPVLADFGICHIDGDQRITVTDEPMGSLNYIAPEMESGRRLGAPSPETDGYSLGKVLYWMLSGGRIFAREAHRNWPLTEILEEQRFEHVHTFLDHVVAEKPSDRIPFLQLRERIKQIGQLVMGNYAPLKPSIGIKCRFCGIGAYERHAGPHGKNITRLGFPGHLAGTDIRALRCGHCGHVELFDFRDLPSDWWEN
jgi:serine/threonine protein kinase